MHIIGAGMAGLLAGAMLRNKAIAIHESQPELPHNHSAVLRFRSTVVGDALGIHFSKVRALKATAPWQNPVADAMAYSAKTNGTHTIRSILSADGTLSERYIAPVDLINQMYEKLTCPVYFDSTVDLQAIKDMQGPVISTIPMPVLMRILGWEAKSEFRRRSGINLVGTIEGANAYCSLYVPDPLLPFSRISITGDQLIAECGQDFLEEINSVPESARPGMFRTAVLQAMDIMGLGGVHMSYEAHHQSYAKILPIDEQERRQFIMWASREHNVFSLGRFATWRPGLLLDDVVNDVRVIQRLAGNPGESYNHHLKA